MVRPVAAVLAWLLSSAVSLAQLPQQPLSPVPLYPGAAPRSFEPRPFEAEPLPPVAPAPETARPADAQPPAGLASPPTASPPAASPVGAPAVSAAMSPPAERVFCEQTVAVQLADPGAVAERFRPFVGIWSDASWTPLLCAALIVEQVTPDGTATIVYVFGPMGANPRGPRGVPGGVPGGILHGSGIIRDGELRFQNSDGSQFAFRPLYADLGGHLTTPQGQSYEAVFKKTP
jgi:hypothetical protein